MLCKFVFQIDWLGNGRKEIWAAGGDKAFLMVEPLYEIVIHLLEKYFVFYLKALVELLYFV